MVAALKHETYSIPLTKGKFALVDEDDYKALSRFKWYCGTKGYAVRDIMINGKKKSMWLHRLIMGNPCRLQTDHINGDKLDNRKSNLRLCNNSQNQANKPPSKQNSSGYRGVHFDSYSGKWRAQIHFNNEKISLGMFSSAQAAAIAYNNAAKERFREFAYINPI